MLKSPDKTLRIPVFFVRNSLAIRAEVNRIEQADATLPDVLMVRAVVELEDKFRPESLRYNHWETNVDGNPCMRSVGEKFIEPTLVGPATFKYRTTLIQRKSTADEDHGWCVFEVSRKFLEMDDPFGRIADINSYANGEPVTILTILSKENKNLGSFGGLLGQGGQQLDVAYEPGSPLGSEGGEGDEVQGADGGGEVPDKGIQGRDIPEFQQLGPVLHEAEAGDKVIVGEEELTANSSVEKLHRAAKYLKVSASGSKTKIFTKIKEAPFTALKMQALEVARQEFEALAPKPRFTDAPKQPSAAERKLHEVTHLPFGAWCAFCVQAKSRGYYKHRSTPGERAGRSFPTVQRASGPLCHAEFHGCSFDGRRLDQMHWSGTIRNKNAGVIVAILARFLSNLSYFDVIEVSYDNEPVLSAGVKITQVIRANQGLPMTPQLGKMYSKVRTGLPERTIQTVRAQGKCLIAFLEDKMKMKIPDRHALRFMLGGY